MKKLTLAPLLLGLAAALPAHATEGALGRPITGLQVQSYTGLVPPTPGWTLALGYVYYSGSIGAKREVPLVGGGSSLGLDAEFQMFTASALYIWDTKPGAWNFASMVTVPLAYANVDATLDIGRFTGSKSQSKTGLYDMTFVPLIASHHFSQTQHMSLALYVYAPTGEYHKGDLTNLSLHNWTFSPTVGYTALFNKGTLEWSTTAAVDIYTKDGATDYQNGDVFRIDSMLLNRWPSGWGLGVVGGWIYQLEKDTGPTADRLNGFKGRSVALGPLVSYAHTFGKSKVEFQARWLHEFDVTNRLKGNPAMISATIPL
ncbi:MULTISPECIES: SphA family protein [Dyella]|nr:MULTISPECIES: transporter [Dyella]